MILQLDLIDVGLDRKWLWQWIEELGAAAWPVRVIVAGADHKREVYMQEYDGEYPGDMAFRAYVDRNAKSGIMTICLFMDRAENADSILWLLIHELAHVNVREGAMSPLGWYFALKRDEWLKGLGLTTEEYLDSVQLRNRDDLHEAEPEEVCVNEVATAIVGKRYDRAWWRARWKQIEEAA